MKQLTTLIVCISLASSVLAQSGNYLIKGKTGSVNGTIILSFNIPGGQFVDSAIVSNGAFEFKGKIENPAGGALIFNAKTPQEQVLRLFVEKGTIEITSADSISNAKITGSKLNQESLQLSASIKPISVRLLAIQKEFMASSDEEKRSSEFNAFIQNRYQNTQLEIKDQLVKFVKENPKSFLSLDVLRSLIDSRLNLTEIQPLFKSLALPIRQSPLGKEMGTALHIYSVTALGATAPDFTQNDPDGKPVSLSSFRGKYVLVDFWASWCGPCRSENPNIVKVFNKYKDKNFTILSVSLDRENGKTAWLNAIKDDGLTWTHVSDLNYWQNVVALQYGVKSIPQNVLLDPKGKIIAKDLRGADLGRKLAELIK